MQSDMARDCKHCSAACCVLCVSEMSPALPCPHNSCWGALEQKHLTLVSSNGATQSSPRCCWKKVSPLTALADGTALIRLVLRVHTLCLRAGCHGAQHLPAWLTSALLTWRHLDSREEIVINTLLNSSHKDTHTQRQQRVFSSELISCYLCLWLFVSMFVFFHCALHTYLCLSQKYSCLSGVFKTVCIQCHKATSTGTSILLSFIANERLILGEVELRIELHYPISG